MRPVAAGLCVALFQLVACTGDSGTGPGDSLDPNLLTPEVAAQLNSAGRFPDQQPEAGYVQPRSRAAAAAMLPAFLDDWFESQRHVWEAGHGAQIQRAELRQCGTIPYASSPYVVTAMTTEQPLRVEAVGRYLITLCGARGVPQVIVSVPVERGLVSLGGNPDLAGFGALGIPVETNTERFVTAEHAVRIAAARTGRRVSAVPELVYPRFGQSLEARWRVQLESPVVVIGARSGDVDTISVVFVGRDTEDAPSLHALALRPLMPNLLSTAVDSMQQSANPIDHFRVRLGMPRSFEPLTRP